MVKDVEAYLKRVTMYGGTHSLDMNLTKASKFQLKLWLALLVLQSYLNEMTAKRNPLLFIEDFLFYSVIRLYISKGISINLSKFFSAKNI
ncbi:hypothetical protein ACFLZI_02015 [Nitrospirota bacterium]